MSSISSYVRIGFTLVLLILFWRYGAWKSWRQYSPTIVFLMVVNLAASFIMYEYPLWYFEKSNFFPNNKIVVLWLTFMIFPLIYSLYLSRYPHQSKWIKQVGYILLWVVMFSLLEGLFKFMKLITYHNGWHFWWSVVVWLIFFVVTILHYTKRRLSAWFICIGFSVFVIFYFNLPITK